MDREAWHAAIHGLAKSWTRLSDWTELNQIHERILEHSNSTDSQFCLRTLLFHMFIATYIVFSVNDSLGLSKYWPFLLYFFPWTCMLSTWIMFLLSQGTDLLIYLLIYLVKSVGKFSQICVFVCVWKWLYYAFIFPNILV